MNIDKTLEERGNQHGNFTDNAEVAQALKEIVFTSNNATRFTPIMCEALDMILHKIARICSGDPALIDHWHDCAGYATLVVRRLEHEKLSPPSALTND